MLSQLALAAILGAALPRSATAQVPGASGETKFSRRMPSFTVTVGGSSLFLFKDGCSSLPLPNGITCCCICICYCCSSTIVCSSAIVCSNIPLTAPLLQTRRRLLPALERRRSPKHMPLLAGGGRGCVPDGHDEEGQLRLSHHLCSGSTRLDRRVLLRPLLLVSAHHPFRRYTTV
jgi:hypothetical protein